jgi:hypothetical protein
MKTNWLYRWGLGAVVGVALATPAGAQTSGLSGVKVEAAEFNGAIPRDVLDDLFSKPAVPAINQVPAEDPVEARVGLATMPSHIPQSTAPLIVPPRLAPPVAPPAAPTAPRISPAASRIPPRIPQVAPYIPQVAAPVPQIAQQIPVSVPAAPPAPAPAAPQPAPAATAAPRFEEPLQPLVPAAPAAAPEAAPVAAPVPPAVSQNLHLTSHLQSAGAPTPAATPASSEPVGASVVDPSQNIIERQPRFPNFATLRTYQIEQAAPEQIAPGAAAPGGAILDSSGVYIAGEPMIDGACCDYDHCGCIWIFGLEATFLVPVRDGLDASIVLASQNEVFRSNGDNNMEFGPRLWFGIQKGCWQFRGRFWSLNGVEDDTNPLLLGTGDTIGLANGSFVDATTVDAEALRVFCCPGDWNLYAGFGFRYAKLHDVANLSGTIIDDQALPGIVQAQAIATHEIDGSGITIPVGGFKPLHRFCCSTLDCFWNLRASVVWGDIDSSAQTSVQVFDPNGALGPGAASRLDAAAASTNDEMFIGEVQVGLRWTHHLQCAPAIASMWIAFEGQWWDSDGGFAFTESAALVNSLGGGAQASSGPNIEMQMIGFTLGAGLNW